MPTFEIEQYELHCQKFQVEAADEVEAIHKLFAGEAGVVGVDEGADFIEVIDDLGLSVDEYPELADGLHALGINLGDVIPSIRSVERIE